MSRSDLNTQCCGCRWCVRDSCGITCAVITWLLLAYGEFCIVFIMVLPASDHPAHQALNALVFHVLFALAIVAHAKTMLTDPGAVPRGNATEEFVSRLGLQQGEVVYKCAKCASIKPARAHHCSTCQRCIKKMDHHCPWVNNCVGEYNQKYFVLFTLYIALVSTHALYWGIWQFVLCVSTDWKRCSSFSPPATTILLIFLLFESLLFAIFTYVMCGTQIHAIWTDETGIESLKQESPVWTRRERWKALAVVFGGPPSIAWLSPFAAPYVAKRPFEYSV